MTPCEAHFLLFVYLVPPPMCPGLQFPMKLTDFCNKNFYCYLRFIQKYESHSTHPKLKTYQLQSNVNSKKPMAKESNRYTICRVSDCDHCTKNIK